MFFFTGIIGFALTILGFVVIPAEKSQGRVEDRRIDIFGVLSFIFGIVGVIYYLSESPGSGWSSAKTLAPFVIGLVLLVIFVVIEFKIDYPIMPHRIWRFQRFVASPVQDYYPRWMVFLIASGVLWAQLEVTNSYWAIPFPALIINMIAMACLWLTCQINPVADAADEDQGAVGAVFNVCLQIGAPIGIAISNIVANNRNFSYRAAFYSLGWQT
ncbi:hypothetical protein BGZ65_004649 [Modicella reniformis]|uniref:Uncharacterized protein n=1 Tax=Modicella reniformis TaxID=1440133 RepID=A0A9P6M8V4_9FUNG|nr:hypothetical protein BGZ65_004649 [Modicella reniformis]